MNAEKREDNPNRFYYGWIIVAVSLVSMAFWLGIRAIFSVFYVALLEDFPWNRGGAAGVQSLAMITYAILAPLAGGLIDRFGPRRVIIPGVLILTLGLILCASIESLAQFYFYYGGIVGTGLTCIGIVSYSAILAHWFEKKRGLANGIAVSGMGLGTFVLVPLSQRLISLWGWGPAFAVLGGLVLIILFPLNAIFLRHKPQELGLYPDGLNGADSPNGSGLDPMDSRGSETEWTLKKALRTGNFWALITFPFLSSIGIFVILVHSVRFLVDQGIDKMTAAFLFALTGVISSGFRIFWGWLSDRIGREKTYSMGVVCTCLGVGSLLFMETTGEGMHAYAFVFFFGMGWGVTAPLFMSVAADLFNGKEFGLIYGILEGAIGIGAAFGAWVAGYIFDRNQSYQWAFFLTIIVVTLSSLIIWLAAPRKAPSRRK